MLLLVIPHFYLDEDFNFSNCTSSISIVPEINRICESPVSPNISVHSVRYLCSISRAGFLLQVLQRVKNDWNYWQTSYSSKEGQKDTRVIAGTCRRPSLKASLSTLQQQKSRWLPLLFGLLQKGGRLESHVNVRVRNSVKKQNETRLLCGKGKSKHKVPLVFRHKGHLFIPMGSVYLSTAEQKALSQSGHHLR